MNIRECMVDKFDCCAILVLDHIIRKLGRMYPFSGCVVCGDVARRHVTRSFAKREEKTHTFHISVGISKASPWLLGL